MRRHLFVRLAATLAVAGLASAGIASSAAAEDAPATDPATVAADEAAVGEGSTDVVVVTIDESSMSGTQGAEGTPDASSPETAGPTGDSATEAPATDDAATPGDASVGADASDINASPDANDVSDDAASSSSSEQGATVGAESAADGSGAESTSAESAADADGTDSAATPPAPTVADVADAIEALPNHVAGEPLSLAEAQVVAAAVCGTGELCVGVAQAYATIQDAIDAAAASGIPNQIIRVSGGAYSSFAVTIAVQILAAEGERVVVENQGGTAISVQANDVVIQGLSLRCTDQANPAGSIGVESIGRSGLVVDGIDTSYCDIGVSLQNAAGTTVANSGFGSSPNGVGVLGWGVTDTTISDNYFSGLYTGLALFGVDGANVHGNAFSRMLTGAHFGNGRNIDFRDNAVWSNDGFGVSVDGIDGFAARGNLFFDNALASIVFKNSPGDHPNSRVLLEGNAIYGSGGWGVYFEADSLADTAVLRDNWFLSDYDFADGALYVDENVGGFVDASQGNVFGWCGPNAVTQGVDLGGYDAVGSASVLSLDLSGCETIAVPPVAIQQTTCATAGTYTLSPLGDAGEYGLPASYYGEDYYEQIEAGTYPLPASDTQVAAFSNLGYDFGRGVYEMNATIPAAWPAVGCDPIPVRVVTAQTAAQAGPVLAETGADGMDTVLTWAAVIGLLGTGLVVASRRLTVRRAD